MLLVQVFKTLWAMLDRRKRFTFVGLIGLLFVAGVLEMTGMLVLFGYVRGLVPNAETGTRAGPMARALALVFSDLSQIKYVVAGGTLVVGVMFTKHILGAAAHFLMNRFLMKLNERVSRRLYEGYLLARFEVFTRRGIRGPTQNINKVFDLFTATFGATAQVLSDGAIVLCIALLLAVVDPVLTMMGLTIFGVMGALLYRASQQTLITMGDNEQAARRRAAQYLSEGLHGVVDARLNNTRAHFIRNYVQALSETALIRRRKIALGRLPQSMNEVLLAVTIVSAVLYMTVRGQSVQDTLPTLAIFAFAGLRMTGAMSRISRGLQTIRTKFGELGVFNTTVEEVAPEILKPDQPTVNADRYLDDEEPLPPGVDGRLHEALTLDDVVFSYPESATPAIRGISLTIPRGAFVSFCGASGGGKSTLLLLLMGMIKPQSGTILCDGRSVFSQVRAWHRGIGYVGQAMFMAGRSVRENVAFGLAPSKIDDAQVWRALEQASMADDVRAFPEGLDTPILEGGARLSGGQRQRIAIARALYKDPEVIVFDEATAALDNVTEREITDSIRRLSGTKTIIAVAHRLSTIRDSDTIFLLQDGRIVASGTYDGLISQSQAFRKLAEPQGSHTPLDEGHVATKPTVDAQASRGG